MNEPNALEVVSLIAGSSIAIYALYRARDIANYITNGIEKNVGHDEKDLGPKMNKEIFYKRCEDYPEISKN